MVVAKENYLIELVRRIGQRHKLMTQEDYSMYILLNAIKNIGRNKGRNILIGGIIFILIAVSIISLSINNTTAGIIDDYKTRFGSEVTIGLDMTKIRAGANTSGLSDFKAPPPITPQQYKKFAESKYLKEYSLAGTVAIGSDELKAVGEESNTGPGSIFSGGSSEDFVMPKFSLIANELGDFKDGFRKLLDDGRMPENEGECIISSVLAELNGLKKGDKINVTASTTFFGENGKQETKTVETELTITGIYFDATEEYEGAVKMPFANRRNEILTTMDTLGKDFEGVIALTAKYYLKDPSMLKDFDAELRALGLDDFYKVDTDEAGYQKVVGPVEGLKKVSLTFLIIVLAFGAVILILLSSIAVRERKYEIGVLRAMGMKKHKVALGFWSEMLIITAICLCFGFGVGAMAAQPVSNTLLSGQVESAKAAEQQDSQQGGDRVIMYGSGSTLGGGNELTPLEDVNVSIGYKTILEIAGIALLLASLASVVAIGKVTRYEPIKILMERN